MIGVDEHGPARRSPAEVVRSERRRAPSGRRHQRFADVGVADGARGARQLHQKLPTSSSPSTVSAASVEACVSLKRAWRQSRAVWGAMLQEAIDLLVIVNALRASRGSPVQLSWL